MTQEKKKPAIRLHILLLVILALVVGVIVWLFQDSRTGLPYECTNQAMGTYAQQTVYGETGEEAATNAAQTLGALESLISWREENSDIARLNENAGVDWISIQDVTFRLLGQCMDVAEASGGAFDPTILPLTRLWDFDGDKKQVPAQEEIDRFLPYVGYENLRLEEGTAGASLKMHGNAVDLGAAGKGAACDAMIAAYEKTGGVTGAVVAVGGSVGVYGKKNDGSDWVIAVRDPQRSLEEEGGAQLGTLTIPDGFLSTSGSYEKCFTKDGVLYHHILDPRTGYPADSGLLSVTVYADSGAMSDILSTACFVLGLEDGLELIKEFGAQAILVDTQNHVYVTQGLTGLFELTAQGYTLQEAG